MTSRLKKLLADCFKTFSERPDDWTVSIPCHLYRIVEIPVFRSSDEGGLTVFYSFGRQYNQTHTTSKIVFLAQWLFRSKMTCETYFGSFQSPWHYFLSPCETRRNSKTALIAWRLLCEAFLRCWDNLLSCTRVLGLSSTNATCFSAYVTLAFHRRGACKVFS